MFPTLTKIKEKLSTQLDAKNGVDEPAVMEVVSILENYPFTGPILEETRIGRMANDLRKKIGNEHLARRLKQLIRNWQNLAERTPPVNGTPGRLVGGHRASLNVSPSPNANHGAFKVLPTQPRGTARTPTQGTSRGASPALQSSRSGAMMGKKVVSPSPIEVLSVMKAKEQPSPALSTKNAANGAPSSSGYVSSPKLSDGQMPLPVMPHCVSPKMRFQTSLPGGRCTVSPVISRTWGQSSHPVSPLIQPSAPHLTKCEPSTSVGQDSGKSAAKIKRKEKGVELCSNSKVGDKITPTPVHSDKTDNGRHDSDGELSCFSRISSSQDYYTDKPLTLAHSGSFFSNQREKSKANTHSRKRTCTNSLSPPENDKKIRIDSSSPSLNCQKPEMVVNGHRKSSKKNKARAASPTTSSCSSVKVFDRSIVSPSLSSSSNDSHANRSQSSVSLHQKSSSPISHQSLSWCMKDKHKGKVKTTEQLIEDLQRKNISSKIGKKVTKLQGNQIRIDKNVPSSVAPASLRPRKRGRKGIGASASVPSSDGMISKNELVERFLKSSDPSASADDYSLDTLPGSAPSLELGACADSCSKDSFYGNFSVSRQDQSESAPKDENSIDAVSPPLPSTSQSVELSSASTLEEIYAQLPPIDYNIDWESVSSYTVPERTPVTEENVERLHNDRQPGINGMYSINGDWTSWQQTMTLPSYEGDPLHILPYVDLF